MAEAAKRAEEESHRKRKHSLTHKSSSAKKLKSIKSSSKLSSSKKSESEVKKKKKKSPEKSKASDVIEIYSESSDNEVLARLKDSQDSDSDVPLVSLKSQTTPKKKKLSADDSDVDSDTPLSKLTPKKKKLKLDSSKVKSPKKRSPSKSPTKSKSGKKLNADGTPKKKGRPRKDQSSPSKKKEGKVSKKGMKQMTLLDIASKKGSPRTPSKSKKQASAPPTPMVIKKLLKLNRESEKDRVKYGVLVKQAAISLTPQQKSNLPANIKGVILKKSEQIKEKKLLQKMTPEERENYLKEKKVKLKAQRMEEQRAKQKELRKRFEDLDLKLTPLPPPKLVPTPDGLPNECFGDVAMITEFLTSYGGLLMPDDEYPIYSDALMKSLSSGAKGFAYSSRVLTVLLQTLLQDEIAEGYQELRVSLSEIPVNPYTASELVRLCLRKDDSSGEETNDDSFELEDDEVSDQILQLLETQEFYQLEAENKLKILRGLCLRILGSYSVQDYMESKQQEANKLSRQKNAEQKQMNSKLKEEKQKQKEENPSEDPSVAASESKPPNLTLNNFYGKKDDTDSGSTAGDSMDDVEGDSLVSVLKRRRIQAAKTAAEKEKREKERKLQAEKEYKEYRKQMEREKFEKTYKEGIALARSVLRQTPIGTDRNHSRYWIFNSTTPGLYIEKGWVNRDIEYNCQSLCKSSPEVATAPTTPKKSDSITSTSPKKTPSKKKAETESSVPHPGQNLWFTYDSVKDLDALMKALHPQGIRESSLRSEIKKQYDNFCKAINLAKRTNNELRDSDGDEEMLKTFRTELIDMELRLRNGGLGGISMFDTWEAKVQSATGYRELGACLKEVQMNVSEKFLKGFMKPKHPTPAVKEVKEEDDKDDDEGDEEEVKQSAAMTEWFDALESCSTYSRLHVLLGTLESCIKWEKSAENAKCKICRKKGRDEALLLCDECNQAFHMYCLRPALAYIPKGDWFCPACIPQCQRRMSREVKSYAGDVEFYYSGDDDEEIEHEEECAECGGDEDLVECATCPHVYHLECHNPPLRHPPRGHWVCSDCKNGGTRRTRNKTKTSRSGRRIQPKYALSTSSEEEEEVEEYLPLPRQRSASSKKELQSSRSSSRRRGSPQETVDQKPVFSRRPPSELSIMEEMIEKIMKHKSAWPFAEPVDKKEVPDYHTIVKNPMDFHTMKNKLVRLSYSSPDEVIKDAALVFRNAAQYNKEDSDVFNCMIEVEKVFIDLLSKKLPFYHYNREPVGNGLDDHGSSSRRRTRR